MATFIGEHSCKLDTKSRIAFPSALKKQMKEGVSAVFVVKRDIYEKCLVMYTQAEWEKQAELIRSKLNPYNKEHNQFLRLYYQGTAEVELDASNRLLIPKRLLDEIEADKDLVLIGIDTKIEIWAEEKIKNIQPNDDFALLAEKILGNQNFEK